MPNEYLDLIPVPKDDAEQNPYLPLVPGAANPMRNTLLGAMSEKPDEFAAHERLARKFNVPSAVIAAEPDVWAKMDTGAGPDLERISKESPALAKWLEDYSNAAKAHDDLPTLEQIEKKFRDANNPRNFFTETITRGGAGLNQQTQNVAIAAVTHGAGDFDTITENISRLERETRDADARMPEGSARYRQAQGEMQQQAKDFKAQQEAAALQGRVVLAGDIEDLDAGASTTLTEIRNRVPAMARAAADNTGEFLSQTWKWVTGSAAEPAAAVGQTVESFAANSGALAAAAAVGIGTSAVATPIAGLGAAGATTFAGTTVTEYGAWVLEQIRSQGIDVGDVNQLRAALSDQQFMSQILSDARAKAVTTGAVEGLMTVVGGRLLSGAAKGSVASKVVAGAKEGAIQAGGSGAGEALAQAQTSQGINWADVADEVGGGLMQDAGTVAIGYGIRSPARAVELVRDTVTAASAVETADQLTAGVHLLKQSKIMQRDPLAAESFVKSMAGRNASFEAESWDSLWAGSGISGAEAAERLTGSVDAYASAIASKTEIVVPMDKLAVTLAGIENAGKIIGAANVVGMSRGAAKKWAASAETLKQEIEAEFTKMVDDINADLEVEGQADVEPQPEQIATPQDLGRAMRRQIETDLLRIGRKPEEAKAAAVAQAAVMRSLAERGGPEALELIKRNMFTVYGGSQRTRLEVGLDRLRAGRVPTDRDMRGPTFQDWLKSTGGVQDYGTELATMDLGEIINPTGPNLDQIREQALEAGYALPDSPNPVLDALAMEQAGKPVFSDANANPMRMAEADWLAELKRNIEAAGLDLATASNPQIAAAIDRMQSEGAAGEFAQSDLSHLSHLSPQAVALVANATPEQRARLQSSIDYLRTNPDPAGDVGNLKMLLDKKPRKLQQTDNATYDPNTRAITLLGKANRSSFMHEAGHWYLDTLGDVRRSLQGKELTEPQARLMADYDAILKAIGAPTATEWEGLSLDQKRSAHEAFAGLFEAYLMRGEAPSQELRTVFWRFKTWLTNIYKTFTALWEQRGRAVQMNPEIIDIMDRVFATDEEIAANKADIEGQVIKGEPQEMRQLRMEARIAAEDAARVEALRHLEKEWQTETKATRDSLEPVIRDMVEQEQIYQALDRIEKEGLQIDPNTLAGELLWDDAKSRARIRKLGVIAEPGQGIPGLDAAHELGFRSVEDMVDRMAIAEPKETRIRRDLDREVAARHPRPRLTDAVRAATSTDARGKLIMGELEWLYVLAGMETAAEAKKAQAVGEAEVKAQAKLDEVKAELARSRDTEILSGQRTEQERQAATDAMEAMQERLTKAEAKLAKAKADAQELRNQRAAAQRIAKERAKFDRQIMRAKAAERVADMRADTVNPDLWLRAERRHATDAYKLAAAGKFDQAVQAQSRRLMAAEMHRATTEARKMLDRTPALAKGLQSERTMKALYKAGDAYVDEALFMLEATGLVQGADIARRERVMLWMEDPKNANEPEVPVLRMLMARGQVIGNYKVGEVEDIQGAMKYVAKKALELGKLASIERGMTVERAAESMRTALADVKDAGATPVGADHLITWSKLKKWGIQFIYINRIAAQMVESIEGKRGGTLWDLFIRPINEGSDAEAIMVREFGKDMAATLKTWKADGRALSDKIDVGGKRHQRETILSMALNWGNETNRQRLMQNGMNGRPMTEGDVREFLNTLDDTDWNMVEAMWARIDKFWPEIREKQRRVTGTVPAKVEASPFQTSTGRTIAGGYYPIHYDPTKSVASNDFEDWQKGLQATGAVMSSSTARGHTKERGKAGLGPLLLNLSVIDRHGQQVIHDLAFHEIVLDQQRLKDHPDVKAMLQAKLGPYRTAVLDKRMTDVATNGYRQAEWTDTTYSYLRAGTSISSLAFNAGTLLMQLPGFIAAAGVVGRTNMAAATAQVASNPVQALEFAKDQSRFMDTYVERSSREVAEAMDQARKRGAVGRINAVAFMLIGRVQQIVNLAAWTASYNKELAADPMNPARAAALADQVVKDSQGSADLGDRSEIMRNKGFVSMLTVFMGPMNAIANNMMTAASKHRRGKMSTLGFIDTLLMNTLIPAAVIVGIKALTGKAEDDEWVDWLMRAMMSETIGQATGGVVGVREVGSYLASKAGGEYAYSGPAGAMPLQALARAADQTAQGEADVAAGKAYAQALGILLHLPTMPIRRAMDAVSNWEEGNDNWQDLLFGR